MRALSRQPFFALCRKILLVFTIISFTGTTLCPPVLAQNLVSLPSPGQMILPTEHLAPPVLKGLQIHQDNPLRFDFILDLEDSVLEGEELKAESEKLIRYFLAALTVPQTDLWVNLSPYEEDRIIPERFGYTEMGRDMLAQDYILKQLTASLTNPEDALGREFWDRVYKTAYEKFGTTRIPVNTFNKVWIMPAKAVVYEDRDKVFIGESRLKVMLETDYLALKENLGEERSGTPADVEEAKSVSGPSSQIMKDIILPEIEREINTGKNFAPLRQIYHSLILATWFKKNLRETFLGRVYAEKNKVGGIDIEDKTAKEKIYNRYVEAFKKGVYDFIREDYDPYTRQVLPRKYFSGGVAFQNFGDEVDNTLETRPIREADNYMSDDKDDRTLLVRTDLAALTEDGKIVSTQKTGPPDMSRRRFLGLGAAAATGAALGVKPSRAQESESPPEGGAPVTQQQATFPAMGVKPAASFNEEIRRFFTPNVVEFIVNRDPESFLVWRGDILSNTRLAAGQNEDFMERLKLIWAVMQTNKHLTGYAGTLGVSYAEQDEGYVFSTKDPYAYPELFRSLLTCPLEDKVTQKKCRGDCDLLAANAALAADLMFRALGLDELVSVTLETEKDRHVGVQYIFEDMSAGFRGSVGTYSVSDGRLVSDIEFIHHERGTRQEFGQRLKTVNKHPFLYPLVMVLTSRTQEEFDAFSQYASEEEPDVKLAFAQERWDILSGLRAEADKGLTGQELTDALLETLQDDEVLATQKMVFRYGFGTEVPIENQVTYDKEGKVQSGKMSPRTLDALGLGYERRGLPAEGVSRSHEDAVRYQEALLADIAAGTFSREGREVSVDISNDGGNPTEPAARPPGDEFMADNVQDIDDNGWQTRLMSILERGSGNTPEVLKKLDEILTSYDNIVLDVGCDNGAFLQQFAEKTKGTAFIGLDLKAPADQTGFPDNAVILQGDFLTDIMNYFPDRFFSSLLFINPSPQIETRLFSQLKGANQLWGKVKSRGKIVYKPYRLQGMEYLSSLPDNILQEETNEVFSTDLLSSGSYDQKIPVMVLSRDERLDSKKGRSADYTANTGGIDFNPDAVNLEIRGRGIEVPQVDMRELETLPIDGFVPMIFNIVPVGSLRIFLGLDEGERPPDANKVTRGSLPPVDEPKEGGYNT